MDADGFEDRIEGGTKSCVAIVKQIFATTKEADVCQADPVGVIEQQTTRDLVPENPIVSGQILVAEQQFLIHRTADLRDDAFPIH